MPSIDSWLTFLPLVSLTLAIVYYALNVRNANRSRNAALYMQLWNNFRNPQFIRDFH